MRLMRVDGPIDARWTSFPSFTPWKINMEPENDGLEDDVPLQLGDV